MEMVSETFIQNLKQSIAENKVSIETIDNAVRNILRLKFRLGLFDNPYVATPQTVKYAEKHLQTAKTAAEQSVILLKNENQTLPFTDKIKNIGRHRSYGRCGYEQWVPGYSTEKKNIHKHL